MTSTPMTSARTTVGTVFDRVRAWSRWFFGVVARKRTYANIAYLLLSFPLGIGYFTVLVTGAAIPIGLGFAVVDMAMTEPIALLIAGIPLSLVLVCIGGPLVAGVLFASIELTALERLLATRLLGADVRTGEPADSIRERARRLVFDRGTWKGVGYLFSKFVFGLCSFIAVIMGFAFTYVLVAAPLHYRNQLVGIHIGDPIEIVPELTYQHEDWAIDLTSPIPLSITDGELVSVYVDALPSALVVSAVGVLVGLVVLHLLNAVAWLFARYTELVLDGTQPSVFSEPPTE